VEIVTSTGDVWDDLAVPILRNSDKVYNATFGDRAEPAEQVGMTIDLQGRRRDHKLKRTAKKTAKALEFSKFDRLVFANLDRVLSPHWNALVERLG